MSNAGIRRIVCALLVSGVTMIVGAIVVWMVEGDRREAERNRVEFLARDHARVLETEIEQALTVTHALGALVRQGGGEIPDFDRVASEMLDYHPAISVLALSPGGVIRQTVPFEENRASIGFDQFADPAQGAEARLARDSGVLTLAGPLELVQGGLGAVGRLPVFMEDAEEEERFWGLVNVVLRIPPLLEAAGFDRMAQLGVGHRLWRTDPNTGSPHVIGEGEENDRELQDPVTFPIELPNGTWFLSSAPIGGWASTGFLGAGLLASLGLSLLLGWLVWLLLALRSHRSRLTVLVEERTSETAEARNQLKATLDAVPDLLFEIDADGVYQDFHSPREDLLAAPSDQLRGRRLEDVVPPLVVETAHRAMAEAERDGWSLGHQYVLEVGGTTRWFEFSVARKPVPPGATPRYIVLSRDITDRKAADEALRESEARYLQSQKLESVGRLAAGVAHDFNNLLTVIQGSAEEVGRGLSPDDPAHRELRELKDAARRGADLTRQLLGYSRRQVLAPRPLEVNTFLRQAEPMVARVLGSGVELIMEAAPGECWIESDSTHLTQVLLNLAANARDAMPEGGTLQLQTRGIEVDGQTRVGELDLRPGSRWVRITVRDTGAGMPAEVLERAFDPFFTTKGPGKGTGLGLATVQGIIRQGGGEVTCESQLGQGTTFELWFPSLPPEAIPPEAIPSEAIPSEENLDNVKDPPPEPAPAQVPSASPGQDPGGSLSGHHILVVEDEAPILRLLTRFLGRRGAEVTGVPDAARALEAAEASDRPPDLLLTDIVMPGMNGVELARRLTARFPGLGVLLVSGYADHRLLQEGQLPPGAIFLPKPYALTDLLASLESLLETPPSAPASPGSGRPASESPGDAELGAS
jgi:PAS domain S-box-containing protein